MSSQIRATNGAALFPPAPAPRGMSRALSAGLFMATLAVGLAACGGGGSGSPAAPPPASASPAPAPAPAPTPAPAPAPEPPAITSAPAASVNDGYAGVFHTARASVAAGRTLAWALSGADAARLTLDAATGRLSFKAAPNAALPTDADGDGRYDVVLTASDGAQSATQALRIAVDAWNKGGASSLPAPVVALPVPQPAGTVANLKVLPWAGFSAAASYTFDDSSPSQIENWPALKAQNVRSTFYVNPSSNWFAGYDAALRDALAQGNELGNHTWNHCRFADLGGANPAACWSVDKELDDTSDYIKTRLGQADVWTVAYPFGDAGYLPAARSRFLLARGVGPGMMASTDTADAHMLRVVAHAGDPTPPGGDPVGVFNADLDAAAAQGRWVVFLFHTLLPTTSNWGLGQNVAAVTGSLQHAKSLGTVWIDSVVNIGAYWIGQQLLASAAETSSGTARSWTWTLPARFPAGRVVRVTVDGGTLSQGGKALSWDSRGYYEVSLDAGSLTWTP